ncbi:DUF2937 family protein [Thalassococcus sp. S3]|uniref:DUF2937 family protein n=1 Tax=Thalassococcus sp. S3 TaxID=2017482 RepID=UPI00102451C9|nr:DUF2937 family protein [Thalassococcus sp. S3]QBF32837.1 hypothetical protein CFI11_16655 [Thalassococcus sp. S3]
MIRALTLAGGIAGATLLSQFPTFSQQYVQRLGGAVDALSDVVADFDASARAVGLSRTAALEQMQGSVFVERRRADMERTIRRYDRLSADLAVLRPLGDGGRLLEIRRFADPQLVEATWSAYRPAVPATFDGVLFVLAGFGGGAAVISVLRRLFRRRRAAVG